MYLWSCHLLCILHCKFLSDVLDGGLGMLSPKSKRHEHTNSMSPWSYIMSLTPRQMSPLWTSSSFICLFISVTVLDCRHFTNPHKQSIVHDKPLRPLLTTRRSILIQLVKDALLVTETNLAAV